MSSLVLFNKPYQVLSQFTDKALTESPRVSTDTRRKTLADYINIKNVYPAGRLDYDSEGLLLLTDDGELQAKISHPKFKMAKTYWVQVEGIPSDKALKRLQLGVKLKDGLSKPAKIRTIQEPPLWPRVPPVRYRESIPTSWLEITISEGRNRQVRRMTAAVGLPTLRLVRYKIGEWCLDDLPPSEYKIITVHSSAATNKKTHYRKRNK